MEGSHHCQSLLHVGSFPYHTSAEEKIMYGAPRDKTIYCVWLYVQNQESQSTLISFLMPEPWKI